MCWKVVISGVFGRTSDSGEMTGPSQLQAGAQGAWAQTDSGPDPRRGREVGHLITWRHADC